MFSFGCQTFNDHILGTIGLINVKQKGSALFGCRVNYVTSTFDLTHDLNIGFSRSNFEIVVS